MTSGPSPSRLRNIRGVLIISALKSVEASNLKSVPRHVGFHTNLQVVPGDLIEHIRNVLEHPWFRGVDWNALERCETSLSKCVPLDHLRVQTVYY